MEDSDSSNNDIIQVLYNKKNKSNGNIMVNSLSNNDNNDLAGSSSNYVHYNDKQYFLSQREKSQISRTHGSTKRKENSSQCYFIY